MAGSGGAVAASSADGGEAPRLFTWLVIGLFFVWGGATSLNDILIPKLKGLYALSFAEVMLTQFAFFMAYFLVSVPAGALVARIGHLRGIAAGLVVAALGALSFWPAAASGRYPSFLAALFVLAAGITILQVASNPFITQYGDPRTASSRLTFAQGFNSLGTTIWPYVGANLILAAGPAGAPPPADPVGEGMVVAHVYVGIAIVFAVIAAIFWSGRNRVRGERPAAVGFRDSLALLARPRLRFGVLAIFCYVGAEVTIGSLLVTWLGQAHVLGLDPRAAGERLAFYWGGAMLGRFAGAGLLRIVEPGRLLALFAGIAAALVLTALAGHGALAAWTLLAVGLFNSLMFPTIFSLASEGLGDKTPEASGLLCMAIVGGAVLPVAAGHVADAASLSVALLIPVACYVAIGLFGLRNPSTPA